ncbi:diacylglycerol kinase epsilon [Oratosquilla oratoria]|uniref:diacylglycerol kinase epsilon n=1 Tax=Oratosquilla oratoria TaxID=337810 RepID=UPI003F7721DF
MEAVELIAWLVFVFVVTAVVVKLSRRNLHHSLRARDVSKGHRWGCPDRMMECWYCNICETLINACDGTQCDACGICAHTVDCFVEANKQLRCKVISSNVSTHKHHWIKGNLPSHAQCEVCEEECGLGPGLVDLQCCWCQRTVHDSCLLHFSEVCDMGCVNDCIVPPNCIRLQSTRLRKQLLVKQVLDPKLSNWSPVIVIGNRLSGSNECEGILASFRRILNPAQVIDLAERPPEEALEWCHLMPPNRQCRVIVAGGDGTVGWVFNAIQKLKLKQAPLVSILPLGTGNDLSRVIGWGEESGEVDPIKRLIELRKASQASLDRWKVNFLPAKSLGIRMPSREVYMNNYLSIGVDALVTYNFHKTRQSPFYIFKSRTINKLIYFTFGTKDVLEHECKDLDQHIEVYMNKRRVNLPNIEAVVILNIPCWGAGVRPWKMGEGGDAAPDQDYSDGILEVFCVTSSFHIAQLQVGLGGPERLGQCSEIRIVLNRTAPMQVDGEPWKQHPGEINVTFSHRAAILVQK